MRGHFATIPLVMSLTMLGACAPAMGEAESQTDRPINAVRIDLRPRTTGPVQPLPAVALPAKRDSKAVWSGNGASASFGYPGEAPLLTVGCAGEELRIIRNEHADRGAQALFAIIGNGRVLRLPVDARPMPGSDRPVWQGALPASDPATGVFSGPVEATLPGAGKLVLPASDVVRGVVALCTGKLEEQRSEQAEEQAEEPAAPAA